MLYPTLAMSAAVAMGTECGGTTFPKCGMGGTGIYSKTTQGAWADCCASCDADAMCKSWTFKASGGDYTKGAGDCELRNATATPTAAKQQAKISGAAASGPPTPPLPPTPPPPPAICLPTFNVTAGSVCNASINVGIPKANTSDATACCAVCATHAACATWIHFPNGGCEMSGACTGAIVAQGHGRTVGVRPAPPPPAPLPPGPLPPKVAAGSQKNIVLLLTDDQDLRLGSMVALPYTQAHVGAAGANISNFFVGTPICCPSRATLLSGRWNHNNKMSFGGKGCMFMNTSRDDNPAFWEHSLPARLRRDHGYATAMFGKVLNVMDTFGCAEGYQAPHLDRALIMCNHAFFNEKWADDRDPFRANATSTALNHTGSEPREYTTSIIGNASIAWMRSVIESGPDHPPFFAWLGPHAPHKPSTPAPWYADHPIGNTPIIKDPMYNYLAKGKHAFLPDEPPISAEDEKAIAYEISLRLRSLLSVDDMVQGIREYLVAAGEWDRTYFVFTSDHGYNLGQFRVDSDKTMVVSRRAASPPPPAPRTTGAPFKRISLL